METERRRAAPLIRRLLGLLAALVFAAACSDGLRPTLVDEPPRSLAPTSTTPTAPAPEPPPVAPTSTTTTTAVLEPAPSRERTLPGGDVPTDRNEPTEAEPPEAEPAPTESEPPKPAPAPAEPEPTGVTEPDDPGSDDEPAEDALEVPRLSGPSGGSAGPTDAALVGALDALAARAPEGGCLVVRRAGETVFSRNPEAMLIPASLQKLLLAEAALEILGAGYTFRTVALAETAPAGGVLDGDLYLVGGGDPLLSTPDFAAMLADHDSAGTPLADLAADLTGTGLTGMTGGVVAVADRYDTLVDVPTWPARFATQSVAGSLSAVSVNQGWRAPPGLITTWGLPPHPAPALRAAEIFDDLLEARSVRIPLVPRVADAGGDYSNHVVLATLESAPLAANLHWLLAESDNTLAEMLLKEIGLVAGGTGTSAAGALAVHEALAPRIAGLAVPADGSGLSPSNRLSCSQVIDVLELGGPNGHVGTNLGVAGRTGTMENRYRNSPAKDFVQAKTGSLAGVASLAGFARAASGDVLSFAVILNSGTEWIDSDAAFGFFADLMEVLVAATGG
ncbi:MAG: D-alanyl-D-alanine carboxypeptidase [bacterium]|nr:D-alanyl-D-alanine carboxypeptidase [bacterium]